MQLRGKTEPYICQPQRSEPIKTCTALCDEWLFPDVDDAHSKRLEKETQEEQGEVVDSDDANSDDEYTLDLLAQVIRERNAPPLDELAKAALANASVREVASVAAAFGKAGRSESDSD